MNAQIDEYGQTVRLVMELRNGDAMQVGLFIRRIMSTQDLLAWRDNMEGLRDWLADQVANYIRNAEFKIWTQGKTTHADTLKGETV